MVALNKKKFKQRHDWIERKQAIIAKKPPKPTAPSKGTTLAKLAEVWRSEVQDIDAEVVEAEKDSQKETFEIRESPLVGLQCLSSLTPAPRIRALHLPRANVQPRALCFGG